MGSLLCFSAVITPRRGRRIEYASLSLHLLGHKTPFSGPLAAAAVGEQHRPRPCAKGFELAHAAL